MSLDFLRRPVKSAVERATALGQEGLQTREQIIAFVEACEEALRETRVQEDTWLAAEIHNNYGASLALLALTEPDPPRRRKVLTMALRNLGTALSVRTRVAAPKEWAVTKTNLAIVHFHRYRAVNDPVDLMAGRVDVDLAKAMFEQLGLKAEEHWAKQVGAALEAVSRKRV